MPANRTETPEYVRHAVAQHLPDRAATPFVAAQGFQSIHTLGGYPTAQVSGIVNLGLPSTGTGEQYIGFWFILPSDDNGTPWVPPDPNFYPEESIVFMSPAQIYFYSTGGGPDISTWWMDHFVTITGTGPDQKNILVIGALYTYATSQPESDVYILRVGFNAAITVGTS